MRDTEAEGADRGQGQEDAQLPEGVSGKARNCSPGPPPLGREPSLPQRQPVGLEEPHQEGAFSFCGSPYKMSTSWVAYGWSTTHGREFSSCCLQGLFPHGHIFWEEKSTLLTSGYFAGSR